MFSAKTFKYILKYKQTAYSLAICCLFMLVSTQLRAQAQSDTSKKTPIEVMPGTGLLRFVQTDTGGVNKLIGNVILKQGDSYLYCDSANFDLAKNNVEAFGNVRIVQPGSEGQSDYMRYIGNQKLAFMKGNVVLTDGSSNLWSEEVEYSTATKIGTYNKGGTLQDGETTLSSNTGWYDMKGKDSRFTGEVIVTDPKYYIVSEDLGYNTNTKVMTFYAKSTVTTDSSVLNTTKGTYDTQNEIAHFTARSSVINEEQYIEADTLDYNKVTGIGLALGGVISIDTVQKTTLYSGRADYNRRINTMLATIKPVLKQMNGDDSLFIRADTLFSFVKAKPRDTVWTEKVIGKGKNKKTVKVPVADTTDLSADSTAERFFIGYHHVKIYSDSMQGLCDSISYSQKDSVMRMMYDPIVWSRSSQITGDTLLLYMDSGQLKKIFVPNNALVISQSGPPRAKLFDQIQGKTLTGYMVNGRMDNMIVKPNAETIYYTKDDNEAYIGVNEVTGDQMRVFFQESGIHRILYERDVKQKMTPLTKADLPNMKLSRFKWLIEKRPKSLSELFE